MFKFNIKWAAPLAVVIVLAAALLPAASTGTFKEAPMAEPGGETMEPEPSEWSMATPERPTTTFGPRLDAGGNGGSIPGTAPTAGTGRADGQTLTRRPLTRADLVQLLAEAFDMPPADVMDDYVDDTVRPRQTVSRAELATAVVRALGLDELAAAHPYDEPVFRDVPADHHAYAAVSMAHRLGLYPFHVGGLFAPDEPVEMAEARQMIHAAAALERIEGPVAYTNAPARTISVQEDERRAISFTLSERSLVVRNDAVVSAEALRPDDYVHVYADSGGELLVVTATGPASATSTVVNEAVKVLRELATPDQLAAIIARDWDRAGAELKASLYTQLLESGLTQAEATALLEQDWTTVEQHGKERLTELLSENASVDPELVRAVLDQDWDTAMSHIEVEVLEYVLNYLMETEA